MLVSLTAVRSQAGWSFDSASGEVRHASGASGSRCLDSDPVAGYASLLPCNGDATRQKYSWPGTPDSAGGGRVGEGGERRGEVEEGGGGGGEEGGGIEGHRGGARRERERERE